MRANILLAGLDKTLATELSRALREFHHAVFCEPFLSARECIRAIDRAGGDLVFCTAEASAYESLLNALREQGREVPVVVVSRLPEIEKWLDAMDAGAADYCAAPFEARLISSIVENTLKYPRRLAAAS
jgi:DNA-binding NtrC family response regulator